jgi:succinyl-CoA synthetase alpha subunit
MAVFAQDMSKVIIQGITGAIGEGFARRMSAAGDFLVGGVTPGRGGESVCGRPVFDSVERAIAATGATASLVVVPPPAVADAVAEAAASGVRLASVYTENVPVRDAMSARAIARSFGMRLVGPNAAGLASPGVANMSDIREDTLVRGPVAIASKSGTLVYEVLDGLRREGLGVSTVACLGGDEIVGTSLREAVRLFAADDETEAVVLIGEIGGTAELDAARAWAELGAPKPLIAYVAGWSAPAGRRMGHAGAIVGGPDERAAAKMQALEAAGALVVRVVTDVAAATALELRRAGGRAGQLPSRGS